MVYNEKVKYQLNKKNNKKKGQSFDQPFLISKLRILL